MTEDYCKLMSGIILSSVWREDDHTRILWVTMLAVKDRDHVVRASVPGLAAVANIPIDSCRAALIKLSSPDPDSRTKEFEGRRIAEVDGGWVVLNGAKYRNYLSKHERNEYQARLMASRRAAQKSQAVSSELARLAQAEAEAEADPPKHISSFAEFWSAYPRKVGKDAAERSFRRKIKPEMLPEVLSAIARAKATDQWRKDGGQFIPHPATWINQGRWKDEHENRSSNPRVNNTLNAGRTYPTQTVLGGRRNAGGPGATIF